MHIAETGTADRRRAPLPGGPTAEVLIPPASPSR